MAYKDEPDETKTRLLAFRKFHRLRNEYKAAHLRWRDNRWLNLAGIEPMIDSLEETRNNCNIASLSGGCAGLVGGILTGAGLLSIPFTVGASAPLIIAGASLAVSGGATGFGAGIADLKISNTKCQEAQVLIDRDVQLTMDLLILEKEYAQRLKMVEKTLLELQTEDPELYDRNHGHINSGVSPLGPSRVAPSIALVATAARSVCLAKFGQISLCTSHVVGSANPLSLLGAAKVVDSVDDVVEAGSQVGVAAARGAKVGIAAAAILCVVGLALDLTSIVYNSRQIHVYRKKKQRTESNSDTPNITSSMTSLNSIENQQNNNNKIYLKSVDREINSDYDLCSWTTPTCKRSPSGNDLWADVVSSDGSLWHEKCIEGTKAVETHSGTSSRRSSGSWEKVDLSADMLIEVDEECLFENRQFSLEFDRDLLDGGSVTSNADTKALIVRDSEGNQTGSLPERLVRKIKHSFTKEYISERAERLKRYIEKLLREAMLMERNPTIADLLQECSCRQCASVGGATRVYCCHERRFYWNSVYNYSLTGDQLETHNTPSLCVTQHPNFSHLYLNEYSLQQEAQSLGTSDATTMTLDRHRLLRYCAYRLIVRSCWGNNDITLKIPDCIHRVVIESFPPEWVDVWEDKGGLGISELWEVKESVTCCIM